VVVKGQQSFNSFWLASTTAVLVTQPAWADTVHLTTVRLNPTLSGVEVLLETPKSESLAVFTSSYGRTFSADIINNTQLRLPKGNTFFPTNPTNGITAVTVMPVDAKSIRVTVTGKAGSLVGKAIRGNRGLVLSFQTTDTSLIQAKSSLPKSHQVSASSTKHQQLPQHKASSASRSNPASNKRNLQQVAQAGSPPPTSTLSPSPTNSNIPTQPTLAPGYLNPSPNPLQFPTRPEEVRIQGTQPITLQQAFELARRNNRTLQISELTLERSRAALREAQAALLPTLNLSAQFANSGQAFINGYSNSGVNSLSSTGNNSGSNATGVSGAVGTVGGSNTTGGGTTSGGGNAGTVSVGNTGTSVGATTTGTSTTGTSTTGSTATAAVISNTGNAPASTNAVVSNTGGTSAGGSNTGGTSAGGSNTGGTSAGGSNTGGSNVSNNQGSSLSGTGASSFGQYGRFSSTALSGTLALSYNIYTSGGRNASIRAAEEQVRYDQLGVETQSQQLRLDVSNDYYNLQGADQQVLIYQAAVRNARASLRDTQAQERAGVGTRFDVLRSQVQLANQIQNLTSSLATQQTYRRQLAQRLSVAQSVDVSAADPVQIAGLWNLSLEDSIVLAFKNRAELEQYVATRNIAEQNRRLALSNLGPQVSFSGQYNINDTLYSLSSIQDTGLSGGNDTYTVGVIARLLLFDGGASRASAAQQEVNKAIAETNFANKRNLVRYDVEQYYSTLQSNLSNIQSATIAVSEATEALRLARLRFQAGVGTQTDVISSENDLTNSQGTRVNAILNYNRSLANLQRAVSSGQPR